MVFTFKNIEIDKFYSAFEAASENAQIFWAVLSDGLKVNAHCCDWMTVLHSKLIFEDFFSLRVRLYICLVSIKVDPVTFSAQKRTFVLLGSLKYFLL